MEAYNRFLKREILTATERQAILFNMCIASYELWASAKDAPDWASLSIPEKELWMHMMRASVRVMFGLMAEVTVKIEKSILEPAPKMDMSRYRREEGKS